LLTAGFLFLLVLRQNQFLHGVEHFALLLVVAVLRLHIKVVDAFLARIHR
jgi:hypothetical protein